MNVKRLSFRASARGWSNMEKCGFERALELEDCCRLVLCGYDRRSRNHSQSLENKADRRLKNRLIILKEVWKLA